MTQTARPDPTPFRISVVLAVLTLLVYLPALRNGFLDYDDQQYVTENFQVQQGLSWAGLKWAFGFHAGNWHPLAWLSHMLDCQIYGLKPWGHHLTNVLLHTASTVLLFLVLNRMTQSPLRSACVAGLFGWHPLHVESVAWVAERKDVLCAFFWLLTMGAYARYVDARDCNNPKAKFWYGVVLLGCALALLSKPMAVTLPFVLLLLDWWPLKRFHIDDAVRRRQQIVRLASEKIPLLVMAAGACVLTLQAQELAIVPTAGLTLWQRATHALVAYTHYAGAMIAPHGMSVYYPYQTTLSGGRIGLAAAVVTLLTVLALVGVVRRPWLAVGWLWFLGTLVPVIGLVQVGDQAWADRYTYLPLIGLFMCAVWTVADIIKNRRLLGGLTIGISVMLLTATTLQLRHWRNTRTLFEHAAKVVPNNYMAITMLGSLLAREGKLDEAIARYRAALQLQPGFPEAHFFLGNALDQQGKLDDAVKEYEQALRFKPYLEQTHILLGVALNKKGALDRAGAHLEAALKINPASAVAHNNLARLEHTRGRLDAAIEHYHAALKLDPQLSQAHNNLGILLLQQGRLEEGIVELRQSLHLSPTNAESQFNLAMALNQQEQWAEAADYFAQTVGKGFNDANAHCQYAIALAHQQRTREAMGQFAQALLIEPDQVAALEGLSWILATAPEPAFRNGPEAVRMAERACELTERKNPGPLKTLAAAYAETGRFPEAIATAHSAQALASTLSRETEAQECGLMVERFKNGSPWRSSESPAKTDPKK